MGSSFSIFNVDQWHKEAYHWKLMSSVHMSIQINKSIETKRSINDDYSQTGRLTEVGQLAIFFFLFLVSLIFTSTYTKTSSQKWLWNSSSLFNFKSYHKSKLKIQSCLWGTAYNICFNISFFVVYISFYP